MSEQMADLLRSRIRRSGISALALSKLCGVPQQRISDFLNGNDIRLRTAQKLADHFGLILRKTRG
jgi:plasmid maintenance system antidote protein VapI